jgi:ELWxxDGT repeat protein
MLEDRTLLSAAKLVDLINPHTLSSNPGNLTRVNGQLFFTASDGGSGGGLWKSDGTAAGTVLVKAFGDDGSYPYNLADVGGELFFAANSATAGPELWKSDGTDAGTVLVKAFGGDGGGLGPQHLVNVNGELFFAATDSAHGEELWKSDGTAAGTVLVKDINPGPEGSYPDFLTNVNGRLFFVASDGAGGAELWKSDGTEAGTVLVKDINPSYTGYLESLTAVGNNVFFAANDGVHGQQLWKSDGTADGTFMVKAINPSGDALDTHTYPRLVNVNGELYFGADDGTHGTQLWKSDGTADGTVPVTDLNPSPFPRGIFPGELTNANGELFFEAYVGAHQDALWKSDGTAAGTQVVLDLSPGIIQGLTNVNGTLYFDADDGVHGQELWKSDGTTAGTVLVKDINPGSAGSFAYYFTGVGGTVFFTANDGLHGVELWKSDGTAAGTVLVKDINQHHPDALPSQGLGHTTASIGGTLYFVADDGTHGPELWKSDGTRRGTQLVKDIRPGPTGAFQGAPLTAAPDPSFTVVNGELYFVANDGTHGFQLWKSDGTADGTVMVKDINPTGDAFGTGSRFSHPPAPSLTAVNGALYFVATDGTDGYQLWESDGTADGTVRLTDVNPTSGGLFRSGSLFAPNPQLTGAGQTLYFVANDGTHGPQLWASDGTAAGTVMLTDVNPGTAGAAPTNLTAFNGALYFDVTVSGTSHLWKSDGTAAGTALFSNLAAGDLTDVNGRLFFIGLTSTIDLYESDGTAAGTVLVKSFPGDNDEILKNLTNVNGELYFSVENAVDGSQLWKSDGTADGTVLVKVINPSDYAFAYPTVVYPDFTAVGDKLYFVADDGTHGAELWVSDGTEAGTHLVQDINPGPAGSSPESLIDVNGTLFFSADDGTHGRELFKLHPRRGVATT